MWSSKRNIRKPLFNNCFSCYSLNSVGCSIQRLKVVLSPLFLITVSPPACIKHKSDGMVTRHRILRRVEKEIRYKEAGPKDVSAGVIK